MLISIITINYNNKEGLDKTVNSVLSQNFIDFEYIIIDGNSSDGSKDLIDSKKDYFSFSVSEADNGIYDAMNKGISASKGDYLLFLNSGDELYNSNVLEEISVFLKTKKKIYYGDLLLKYDQKSIIKQFPDKLNFSYFFYRGYLPHPATFIERSLFEELGPYNKEYKLAADWDFLVNAICKHNVAYQHMATVVSIFDKNGVSNNPDNVKILEKEKDLILSKNFPLFKQDTKELLDYRMYFKSNRFELLRGLEKNVLARKINTVWLKIMSAIFR